MIMGITEEDEEEEDDMEDMEEEEVDQFGPELVAVNSNGLPGSELAGGGAGSEMTADPTSPLSPLPGGEDDPPRTSTGSTGKVPLTAEALAKMEEEEEAMEEQQQAHSS